MRCGHPERSVNALHLIEIGKWCSYQDREMCAAHLLDDGTQIWQTSFICSGREVIPADDSVELFVSPCLDVRVRGDEGEEPLDDGCGLAYTISFDVP